MSKIAIRISFLHKDKVSFTNLPNIESQFCEEIDTLNDLGYKDTDWNELLQDEKENVIAKYVEGKVLTKYIDWKCLTRNY